MEYIYIAHNPLIKGMVKVGRTRDLSRRLIELSQILPKPFEYVKTYKVESSVHLEKHIHKAIHSMRANNNREFFNVDSHEQIIHICDELIADYSHFYLKNKYKSVEKLINIKQFAEIVNKTRIAKGLTQQDLSSKSGVSLATIARVESNKCQVSLDIILKLFDVLECSIYVGLSEDRGSKRRRVRKYYHTIK